MDNVIAAMEANHPNLTTQKSFYVEISRARYRAELVTDDAAALREQLEALTGERISALEGIGEAAGHDPARVRRPSAPAPGKAPGADREAPETMQSPPVKDAPVDPVREEPAEPQRPQRGREVEIELR